jgi:hypothetical protein
MGLVLVPSLHGYALYDRIIKKFAENFRMAAYNKSISSFSIDNLFIYTCGAFWVYLKAKIHSLEASKIKWLALLIVQVVTELSSEYGSTCKTSLTPKGPMSVDGFLGSSSRLSWTQKHEWSSEILEEGGPM